MQGDKQLPAKHGIWALGKTVFGANLVLGPGHPQILKTFRYVKVLRKAVEGMKDRAKEPGLQLGDLVIPRMPRSCHLPLTPQVTIEARSSFHKKIIAVPVAQPAPVP